MGGRGLATSLLPENLGQTRGGESGGHQPCAKLGFGQGRLM